MWSSLRDRQLSGVKFRRQFAVQPYVLDFYAPRHRLAIELDGSQHLTADGLSSDAQRTAFLESFGIRVVRFTNVEVLQELPGVLARIVLCVTPSPFGGDGGVTPSPFGGEGGGEGCPSP